MGWSPSPWLRSLWPPHPEGRGDAQGDLEHTNNVNQVVVHACGRAGRWSRWPPRCSRRRHGEAGRQRRRGSGERSGAQALGRHGMGAHASAAAWALGGGSGSLGVAAAARSGAAVWEAARLGGGKGWNQYTKGSYWY